MGMNDLVSGSRLEEEKGLALINVFTAIDDFLLLLEIYVSDDGDFMCLLRISP